MDDPNISTALCIVATRTRHRFRNPRETGRRSRGNSRAPLTRHDCTTNVTRVSSGSRCSCQISMSGHESIGHDVASRRFQTRPRHDDDRSAIITGTRSWQPDFPSREEIRRDRGSTAIKRGQTSERAGVNSRCWRTFNYRLRLVSARLPDNSG